MLRKRKPAGAKKGGVPNAGGIPPQRRRVSYRQFRAKIAEVQRRRGMTPDQIKREREHLFRQKLETHRDQLLDIQRKIRTVKWQLDKVFSEKEEWNRLAFNDEDYLVPGFKPSFDKAELEKELEKLEDSEARKKKFIARLTNRGGFTF